MPAKSDLRRFSPDAEIDRADLDELAQISMKAACDITRGTITPKEGNAISRRVGKRLKAVEQELRTGNRAALGE